MEPENYQGPGLYRHYKGGVYLVHRLGIYEPTGAVCVIYEPVEPVKRAEMAGDFSAMCMTDVRPLDVFNESVEVDGKTMPRFTLLSI
jgi:hypothetical protein